MRDAASCQLIGPATLGVLFWGIAPEAKSGVTARFLPGPAGENRAAHATKQSRRLDPAEPGAATDHVLGRFALEEQPLLEQALDRAAEAIHCAQSQDLAAAMNRFNTNTTTQP